MGNRNFLKKTHKLLIVEDDLVVQKISAQIIRQHFPEIEIVGVESSVAGAYEIVKKEQPNLMLMDIQLDDGNAFDLLRKIELYDFKVIFLSAYKGYMEEAIHFSAVGFIQKPFDVTDFVMALDKAMMAISTDDYMQQLEVLFSNVSFPAEARTVVFPTVGPVRVELLTSLQYGEAVPGGSEIVLDSGEHFFVPRPLRRYEQLFAPYDFVRCHPLYIVNLRKISAMDADSSLVTMENGQTIPVEERKFNQLSCRYQEMMN